MMRKFTPLFTRISHRNATKMTFDTTTFFSKQPEKETTYRQCDLTGFFSPEKNTKPKLTFRQCDLTGFISQIETPAPIDKGIDPSLSLPPHL